MTIELIIALAIIFLIGYLGSVILYHNPRNFSSLFFFLICASTIFWSIANYFSWLDTPNKIFWIRLVLFFASFHLLGFYLFIKNYPNENLIINKIHFLIIVSVTILIAGLTLSDKILEKIIIKNGVQLPAPGKLMPLFSIFIVSLLISTIISAINKTKTLEAQHKKSWVFIISSLSIGYFLIILSQFIFVNVFQNVTFIPFGPLFMLPVILGMSYSILKYQALNIRIISAEVFVLFMLSLVLVQVIQSKTSLDIIINLIILSVLFFLGILLIKSVYTEVQQKEQLEQLNRIKSEFLSFASHQVKAPMAVVKGYAELIYSAIENVPDQAKDFAKKIKESVDNLLVLIEEFMDYRRIEEGKLEFNFENIEVVSLIKEIVNNFQLAAKQKKLDLTLETSLEQAIVKVDKLRFSQVIQNLIDNAIKYTPSGWVKVNISKDTNNMLIISVSDSGIGMSKEVQTKLFGEFVRDPSIKKEIRGTGLGLYIAKNIIEAHQGKIWAESEGEGKGSKFYVKIPL